MLWLVGESHNLCFDTWAIARSYALDLSIEKGRVGQSATQYFVHFFVGIASPALQLFQLSRLAHEREAMEVIFSVLGIH